MKRYGIAIEGWDWDRKSKVRMWLVEHAGVHGDKWGENQDYNLETLWMDEDIYVIYKLKWL